MNTLVTGVAGSGGSVVSFEQQRWKALVPCPFTECTTQLGMGQRRATSFTVKVDRHCRSYRLRPV